MIAVVVLVIFPFTLTEWIIEGNGIRGDRYKIYHKIGWLYHQLKLSYRDVEERLQWGESNELEFKPEPQNEQQFREYIFETTVGMANTGSGNIVIGVREEKQVRTIRTIEGVKSHSASDISDKLMRMINEYVDPRA